MRKIYFVLFALSILMLSIGCYSKEELEQMRVTNEANRKVFVEFRDTCKFKIINFQTKHEYLTDNYTIDNGGNVCFKNFVLAGVRAYDTDYTIYRDKFMLLSAGLYGIEGIK